MKKHILGLTMIMFSLAVSCTPQIEGGKKRAIDTELNFTVLSEASILEIPYTVINPGEGEKLIVSLEENWLSQNSITPQAILIDVDKNIDKLKRSVEITLSYKGAEDVKILITQDGQEKGDVSGMTFEITIHSTESNTSSSAVTLSCIPSNADSTYVAYVMPAEQFERITDWGQFYKDRIAYMLEWGYGFGATTDEEAMALMLRNGSIEEYKIGVLISLTDYVYVAFGMEIDGTVTSTKVTSAPFRTPEIEPTNMTFELGVRDCIEYSRLRIVPSELGEHYYWDIMKKSDYEAAGDDLPREIIDSILALTSEDIHMSQFLYRNEYAYNDIDLEMGEEYVLFAFGCHFSGTITTGVTTLNYIPQAVEKVDCDFMIKKEIIRAGSFSIEIAPSDNNVKWFAYTVPYELLDNYQSAEAMTDDVIDIAEGLGVDWISDSFINYGEKILNCYQMLGGQTEANSAHFVGVYGINDLGTRVTDLAVYKLTTLEDYSISSDLVIDIKTIDTQTSGMGVEFIPNQNEIYFYDIQSAAYVDAHSIEGDDVFAKTLLDLYYGSSIDNKLAYSQATLSALSLENGVEYYAVAFAIDRNGYSINKTSALYKHKFTFTESTANNKSNTISHKLHSMSIVPFMQKLNDNKETINMQ